MPGIWSKLRSHLSPSLSRGVRLLRWRETSIWFHWVLLFVCALHFAVHVPWQSENLTLEWVLSQVLVLPLLLIAHALGHLALMDDADFESSTKLEPGNHGAESFSVDELHSESSPKEPRHIVLFPVGEIGDTGSGSSAHAEIRATLGGPIANGTLLFICLTTLSALGQNWLPNPNSVVPPGVVLLQHGSLWGVFLLLINLIPCVSTDAGRLVTSLIWRSTDDHGLAVAASVRLSRFFAFLSLLLGVGIFIWSLQSPEFRFEHPVWIALGMGLLFVGLVHFYESRRLLLAASDVEPVEEAEFGPFGYDFSQGYTSLERSAQQLTAETTSTLPASAEASTAEARNADDDLHDRVDELLVKIHKTGMSSLSKEEQRFLQKASDLYQRDKD